MIFGRYEIAGFGLLVSKTLRTMLTSMTTPYSSMK